MLLLIQFQDRKRYILCRFQIKTFGIGKFNILFYKSCMVGNESDGFKTKCKETASIIPVFFLLEKDRWSTPIKEIIYWKFWKCMLTSRKSGIFVSTHPKEPIQSLMCWMVILLLMPPLILFHLLLRQ